MIENALRGDKRYWTWVSALGAVVLVGVYFWFRQFHLGLTITGLSRDVVWGFYIAQFTFLVGVAASAVMVVLPYYLHNYKQFGKLTILGEFLAIAAVIMCMAFIFVDMGQPFRIGNVFLHPSPNSMMFWDTVSVFGYLFLNIIISRVTFRAEKKGVKPPNWIRPIIILSIPWAISIHTVTAFLYSGLAGRPFWLSAVMAPRFLATAFSAGPALLVLIMLVLRKISSFDAGKEPIRKLAIIIMYAMALNVFFLLMEIFTASYSGMPEHIDHFKFLYFGLDGYTTMVPWMWGSAILAVFSLILLFNPKTRNNETFLAWACVAVFASIWIDKGLGMVVTGFTPNPFGTVTPYSPTFPEVMISLAIYAIGALIVTFLYKVALSVRARMGQGYEAAH
ncbi:polysulfide reductase NrfD [bacterium]|nr:polysulfide reductase NrfD [bacterium]